MTGRPIRFVLATSRTEVVAALLLLLAGVASATTLVLRNGKKVEGQIVERDEQQIKIKVANGKTETYTVKEIDHIEEAALPPTVSNETGDAPVDARTKEYERLLGFALATAPTEFAVVRGDQPLGDLKLMAGSADKVVRNFLETFQCRPEDALHGDRYGAAKIDILQFLKEDAYLVFCDKVLARIRDSSVDDVRLAFMRRQRGFWIVSPRPLMAQYQGPSDLVNSISAACHKTSHVLLHGWKPSGAFVPWWLYEGFATWQEFAVLNETRTYCIEPARPDSYGKTAVPDADEAAKARSEPGWRARVKWAVGKRNEKEFATLGKLSLNELVYEDVQQSWSVVDWLSRTSRLKEFVTAYKDVRDLDAACKQVLGVPASGAHEQWRVWVMKTY